ncbi:MAG: hypothetical protein ACR2KK_01440 [Acidimicrobiales bacterium]
MGAVPLGADPDDVVALLTERWGPPDLDTGWEPGASSRYGVCPGRSRGAEWNHLAVLFSDGGTGIAPAGRRHFFGWLYGEPGEAATWHGEPQRLATPDGLTAGSTVADLRRVYGPRLDVVDTDPTRPSFTLRASPGEHLSGMLSGVGPTATVQVLAGGSTCGDPRLA